MLNEGVSLSHVKRSDALNLMLTSIALEEIALAGLIRGAADELQLSLQATGDCQWDKVRQANEHVCDTLKLMIKKELLLLLQLEEVLATPIVVGFDDCDK